jgi:unsaturated pyranuronate lyase
MPVIADFDKLASVPEEQITDKIRRRVVSGTQGTMVYWRMKAGARAAAHKHPHEQFVWMVKGTMDFRIGDEKRTMKPGDVAVIPGGVEHEGYFPEDSEVIDFFAPVREDFWHLADIAGHEINVRFRCKSGHHTDIRSCPLMTQSGHRPRSVW